MNISEKLFNLNPDYVGCDGYRIKKHMFIWKTYYMDERGGESLIHLFLEEEKAYDDLLIRLLNDMVITR